MTDLPTARLPRPGVELAYRVVGDGPPLLLLHATLSSSRQLQGLARRLAGRFRVVAVDRRASGESILPAGTTPAPIDVAVHVADLVALIDAEALQGCLVVGHSYGGCLALELAARRPALVARAWAYEPPYGPLAPPQAWERMDALARATLDAAEREGLAVAAEVFLAGVSGRPALDALGETGRARIGQAGPGAVADASLLGLDAAGLSRIACPTSIATGGASGPLYPAIAEALLRQVPGAQWTSIPEVDHMAPITRPDIIAGAVERFADR
jgi:pimeloyl-ACP methyl ester carboxylesterase